MQTERVTYLTNTEQKAALEAFAKSRGESVGSVLRKAAARYISVPGAGADVELGALVDQVNAAMPRMSDDLDAMSAGIRETRAKLDKTLRKAGVRQ